MLKHFAKVNKYLYFLLGIVIIFSVGIVYTTKVTKDEEAKIRKEMLALTQTYANVLDAGKFASLQQNLTDKENPDYKIIKDKLISIADSSKTLGIKWIYTIIPKDDQIVFSVDSILVDSPEYSDPGDVYVDANPSFINAVKKAWEIRISSITEPYTDKWGTFISTIVPIVDKENNITTSVLASDMDYKLFYQGRIDNARRLPAMVTILLLVSFSYLFFYIISIKKDRQRILALTSDIAKSKNNILDDDLRMKTIISSIGEGLIIIDRKYRIKLLNPKATELLGYKKNEILGKDLRDVVKIIKNKTELSFNEWPTEKTFITKQITTTSLEDDLSIATDKQKNYLAVTLSIAPLNNNLMGDPGEMGLVIVVRDANKDRELDRVKSGFISIASHQLRAPLTSVRWSSEILLSENSETLSKNQIDLLKEINDGIKRLCRIINILLDISRIENGKIVREKKPINLTTMTEEVLKEFSLVMGKKNLVFSSPSLQINPDLVRLDPILIKQVIFNLLANAVSYSNNNTTIEGQWAVDKEKNEVIYSIKDSGIGIPIASQSRIFSKFFRANNAMLKVSDGTGLSLAFVKDIVLSWGGRVWFETKEGEGSTFFFTIPILEN